MNNTEFLTLPRNEEAEQKVIGSLLVNNDVYVDVDFLNPEDFYNSPHKVLFKVIQEYLRNNEFIDFIILSNHIKEKNLLEGIPIRAYINDLVMDIFSTSNIQYYAKIIKENSQKRQLMMLLNSSLNSINENSFEVSLSEISKSLIEFDTKNIQEETIQHVKNYIPSVNNEIDNIYNKKSQLIGIDTGFRSLNRLTTGFQKGELIIIGGRPSMGKSALATNIVLANAFKENFNVVYFDLENSINANIKRLLSIDSKLHLSDIRNPSGIRDSGVWEKLYEGLSKLSNSNIYVSNSFSTNHVNIRYELHKIKRKIGRIDLIVVDYLQLLTSTRVNVTDNVRVSENSRGLKAIAKEFDIPVIVLSQLSREVEKRLNRRPMLSDLRDSGSIEQDADTVLFVYREEYYNKEDPTIAGVVEINAAKGRNTGTGKIKLIFNTKNLTFIEEH